MSSVRMWLGSGSVLAGVGAAMLCAGSAAADTGSDTGPDNSATRAASASSSAPQRGANRAAEARPRAAAAAARTSNTRDALTNAFSRAAAAVPPASRPASPAAASRSDSPAPTSRAISTIPDRAASFAAAVPAAAAVSTSPVVQPKAAAAVAPVPAVPEPVDPAQFAGTYYEQGSVKQFFSIGLVNTKAVYTLKPDGTIKVENSGNYFFNRGPKSSIVGSAVPVNDTNTALNVGFGPFNNSAKPPGNYTILAHAPDYNWVIVSDPTGKTGYILTRSKTIPAQDYQQFVSQARSLGVTGRITATKQYPA